MELARRTMRVPQPEKGCILDRFAADLELSNQFILMEIRETEADLNAHLAGAAIKYFFDELPGKGILVGHTAWQGLLSLIFRPTKRSSRGKSACISMMENSL